MMTTPVISVTRLFSTFIFLLIFYCAMLAAAAEHPIMLGIDMAGSYHIYDAKMEYWSHEPYYQAVNELGGQFINIHLYPELGYGDWNSTKTLEKIGRMDAGMRAHGLKYQLNNEDANFYEVAEITPGVNEYTLVGGLHRWDFRMAWLNPILDSPAFMGVVYDEADHMQIENNRYPVNVLDPGPPNEYDVPYLVNTWGMPVPQAWAALANMAANLRTSHYQNRVPLFPEQLWTGMSHIWARAGWTLQPKIMKETITAPVLADNLGAGLQYADRTKLYICCDLHRWYDFPGHSPAALKSALLTAYWIGADAVFVENMDWMESPSRFAGSDPGGLVAWSDPTHYTVTQHGAVVKDFYKNYVPAHPRNVDWRNFRPRVAIVRLPDSDWGRNTWNFFRDRLLGNPDTPSNARSQEWLNLWPILTHGAMGKSTSIYNNVVYPGYDVENCGKPGFFVPIDSVAVFDHTVTGPVLDSVKCFVVCGYGLEAATFNDIKARVAAGATCIISRYLYSQYATGTLPGDWLIVDQFTDSRIATKLAPFLGEANVARYRFQDQVVEFKPTATPDELTVTVFDRTRIDEFKNALIGKGPEPVDADLNHDGQFDVADLVLLVKKFD
ncbi:hypothetical protein LLG95_18825 [bacterium]|nr:hypothetical protein [bacterium]